VINLFNIQAQGTSVSFWVIPPSLQHVRNIETDKSYSTQLNEVAPAIKKRMIHSGGRLVIAYQSLECKQLPNFFRITFPCHPMTTNDEIDYMIKYLDDICHDM
jgi:hypothetical protein